LVLLADELRELVAEDSLYTTARKRALALFLAPLSLGAVEKLRQLWDSGGGRMSVQFFKSSTSM
jgi:hypothetical protein